MRRAAILLLLLAIRPAAAEVAYLLAGSGVDFADDRAIRWRLPGTRSLGEAVAVNVGLTPEEFGQGRLGTALTAE